MSSEDSRPGVQWLAEDKHMLPHHPSCRHGTKTQSKEVFPSSLQLPWLARLRAKGPFLEETVAALLGCETDALRQAHGAPAALEENVDFIPG